MRKFFRGASFYILLFIILLIIVQQFGSQPPQTVDIEFSSLYKALLEENVKEMYLVDRSIEGVMIQNNEKVKFKSFVPEVFNEREFGQVIDEQMRAKKLKFEASPPPTTPWFINLLPSALMILIFVVFWFVFMQQSQGGGNRVMSFGKSRAKLHKDDEKKKVTFKDVAGLDEEKEELQEVVDFLRNPKKYMDLGARIPKGILMVGPPGTGKTYLTKAVAGEAGVPFFSISGSDFVEMFVGVGASRVRDLFEQAKKSAPCIIFIDEIDAVGRRRGAGLGGGHDEREQTLNQLLVEMDGFGVNEGIIIVAATNRPDILDPALLRPGRFDRQVMVGAPDVKGREEILKVHSKGKPLAEDVDLKVLARRTPGFTPADIENLMNEAALLTARKNGKTIEMATVEEAITKVIAGVEKKSRVISEKERKLTAYHEAGHAVVARLLPNYDPVHHVTIIPRGRAGGFTMTLPTEDKYYATKTEMEDDIVDLLGGRMAEKLVLHDISTGAQNDLQRVTSIAKAMVTKYGMSEKLGSMAFSDDEEVFIGRDYHSTRNYSEAVAAEIDNEIRRIVDEAYERTEKLLTANIDKLHTVAQALLKIETLDADQFEMIFSGEVIIEEKDTLEDVEAKIDEAKKNRKNNEVALEKDNGDNNDKNNDDTTK
ncbi:ATP-dependent zinc metalloprotease FtsH [Alkaliphilus sp. MSJ-5]|uniref:ATP-dependent zinc metalloprotease FtsH n=1 Tax=Alkaliphilus flagellatus TaxID=2841507 RepID=A0ABS6G1A6_9FIRM|nr:ATP-dependent zinc metalloprotease FtsH [Alkaliphilus flagellatus]MBU5676265.1 ATP-dependent zinc metalloprotease FtsH [Alkaliphilus flagellatus]